MMQINIAVMCQSNPLGTDKGIHIKLSKLCSCTLRCILVAFPYLRLESLFWSTERSGHRTHPICSLVKIDMHVHGSFEQVLPLTSIEKSQFLSYLQVTIYKLLAKSNTILIIVMGYANLSKI